MTSTCAAYSIALKSFPALTSKRSLSVITNRANIGTIMIPITALINICRTINFTPQLIMTKGLIYQ